MHEENHRLADAYAN